MFNNPMGAGQRAGENIEAQFQEELIDICCDYTAHD